MQLYSLVPNKKKIFFINNVYYVAIFVYVAFV